MSTYRPHEKLVVWKRAIDLCVALYRLTDQFPASEKYGLVSQMRRAAVSVGSNIAEGADRGSTKLYIYFLQIAPGSLSELDTQLVISNRLSFIDDQAYTTIKEQTIIIGKMITNLVKRLRGKGVCEEAIPYSPFPNP